MPDDRIPQRDVMIPLRDGVRLATDLYFPPGWNEDAEPLPVILSRTPYDRRAQAEMATGAARHGYIFAAQDVRGRYQSEGEFYPFAHEGPDGYDVVEWLAGQPWCSGRVGTIGQSYCAAVQNALASLNPPHLSAMVVTYGPSSYYHHSMRHNGALEMRFYVYAFTMAASSREAQANPTLKAALDDALANIWDWVRACPIQPGETPLALVPSYERWLLDILRHARYDDYWRQPGYGPQPWYDRHADVPTLYIGGWYDSYTRATVTNFVELSARQSEPVHLLMGPWHHGGAGVGRAGDAIFGPDGSLDDYLGLRLAFFDRFVRGDDADFGQERAVRYFIMGGGEGLTAGDEREIRHGGGWREADAWPPEGCEPTEFFLQAGGRLQTRPPREESAATSWTFDPADPVPTIGGNLSALGVDPGAYDQRNDERFPFTEGTLPLSARRDVLCFATEPLEEDVTIAGPVEVVLWVSTDAPDTDFTAKLLDVYPPGPGYPAGCAMNLTDGIMRLRFREGFEREEFAQPGEIYELRFELYPTANRFVAGHRIRVDVSSSNFPRFELNSNTGGPPGVDRRRQIAQNTLHHDTARPSRIVLSVLAEGDGGAR
ncbi:MAG: CocE/NonD family hydrolase [Armatimonadota bacterium]